MSGSGVNFTKRLVEIACSRPYSGLYAREKNAVENKRFGTF